MSYPALYPLEAVKEFMAVLLAKRLGKALRFDMIHWGLFGEVTGRASRGKQRSYTRVAAIDEMRDEFMLGFCCKAPLDWMRVE